MDAEGRHNMDVCPGRRVPADFRLGMEVSSVPANFQQLCDKSSQVSFFKKTHLEISRKVLLCFQIL